MSVIVKFENITKNFPGVRALSHVSLDVKYGEVHAVVGENGAGKSTLMNILGGLFDPTEGKIYFEGKEVDIPNEQASLQLGIGVVYQEMKLCPNLSIVENIFLGREIRGKRRKIDWKSMKETCIQVLDSLGLKLSPDTLVKSLSIAEQQIVEIAKSLARDIKVLVLDEPTSALTMTESQKLFSNIHALKKKGVSIIYISHRLEEIIELSDRISVLRDGEFKGTFNVEDVNVNKLVKLIAGEKLLKELSQKAPQKRKNFSSKVPYVVVENLSSSDGSVQNVSFNLKRGEILGFYGVQGAGRTEMLQTIFGLRNKKSGSIKVDNIEIENRNPMKAIENGFAMVPENRREAGLFPNMNILENINISNAKDIIKIGGLLKKQKMKTISEKYKGKIGIKTRDIYQSIMQLSGGNQQKVIIARWLASKPQVFLVDELTRGVDVGAKSEIFSVLRMLQEQGLGIILVSSELQEVIAEADRVLVMKDGRIVKELTGNQINKDEIVEHALLGKGI
ncbi:MAG: sugar ABC transporter ATP-binding protein [Spirochaetia bacterium]|nr:sugar ABC transporter ATP-binding protein [Spirochaetia bacterium]MCF7945552.1 sugar ABC transporter ATP-binding protein [Spirochaetia bacterium]MCF7946880.1 sugar ABC transporter ATP-binding protein [Spirochaetia bacterium]